MTVRLRAHHLLCVLTYVGRGYSRAFTENYDAIVARLVAGEDVALVAGPDEICAPELEVPDAHCLRDSVVERDQRAAQSVGDLLGRAIVPGQRLDLDAPVIARLRQAFKAGEVRSACLRCEWFSLCTEIADRDYPDVRLAQGRLAPPPLADT